jgi:hypothetical protein
MEGFMPRFRHVLLIALLLTPQFAQAQPIAEFSSSVLVQDGQTGFYQGTFLKYNEFINVTETYQAFTGVPMGFSGEFTPGTTEVRFAGQSKESYEYTQTGAFPPPPDGPNNTTGFVLRVNIKDLYTGDTGYLDFDAHSGFITALPADLRGEALLEASGTKQIDLGFYRYTVTLTSGDTDSNAWIYGTVSTNALTPEPGTMALAGMGLVSAFGLRRRLRNECLTALWSSPRQGRWNVATSGITRL